MPSAERAALPSEPTWSRTVPGTTPSPSPKRMVTLPSAPRWKSCPPAERPRLSVTETGSLRGQATPYVPFSVSSAVTSRNSGQLQGFSGVGIRTPEDSRIFVLAIRTLGSWRNGTP